MAKSTKWGILSAGKISNDFVAAMKSLPRNEHVIVGIAARDVKRAEEFAKKYEIPLFYGSYEELLANPDIEVVYIGALHPQHCELVKRSLESGKSVLCEKPLCMNHEEARQVIKMANKKNLFLMEAVWSRCFPVYEYLKKLLSQKAIGEVLHLDVKFGSKIIVDRIWKKELGGGTVLDLGVYLLQLALLVFDSPPEKLHAVGHLNEEGVDENMACVLSYADGASAVLSCHAKINLPNSALITGTKGSIELHRPFWAPTKISVFDENQKLIQEKEFPLPTSVESFNFINSVGLSYEAAEVRRCLKEGLKQSPLVTNEDSLLLAKLEDEIRKQLGVNYVQDEVDVSS